MKNNENLIQKKLYSFDFKCCQYLFEECIFYLFLILPQIIWVDLWKSLFGTKKRIIWPLSI